VAKVWTSLTPLKILGLIVGRLREALDWIGLLILFGLETQELTKAKEEYWVLLFWGKKDLGGKRVNFKARC